MKTYVEKDSWKENGEMTSNNALIASEVRYRRLFESAKDGILILDAETGMIIDVNPFLIDLLGYSKNNFVEKEIWEIGFFKDIAANKDKFQELQQQEYVRYDNLPLETAMGRKINVEFVSNVYLAGNKRVIQCNIRDNTESKRTEKALLESEIKYRAFFENSMDAIMLTSPDGKTLAANPAACSMFGYSEDELINLGRSGIVDPADDRLSVILAERKLNGKAQGELTFIRSNGTRFPAEISSALFKNHEGHENTSMIIRDIADRKNSEKAIQQSEKKFQSYIDNAPDGVFVVNETGKYIDVNNAACKSSGYSRNDLLNMSISDILTEESFNDGLAHFNTLIQNGKSKSDLSFKHKDGSIRWWSLDAVKLTESSFLGFTKDITDRKLAEETLLILSSAIEQTVDSIIITNRNGRIEYVNHAFELLTGYSAADALGKTPRILKSDLYDQTYYEVLWETILSGKVFRAEVVNLKKNGDLFFEEKTISPIFDKNKKITHFVGTGVDITERKYAEKELIKAKEKAEESDRLKSSFLANMSHEIRTPLNSIIGFSELLADSYFAEDQKKEFIQNIITSGNNLLSIISDIMDISKLEAGEYKIRNSQINVSKFLSSVKVQFAPQAEEKKLGLKLTLPDKNEETEILADSDRLRQVLNNLMSNAIKFTATGNIEIGYQRKGKMVEFFVKDTGIGIPVEYHKIIFDRFRQIEASATRNYGGNGLGLTISKNLVELMGGEIWVEHDLDNKQEGKGAAFYFTVPIYSEKGSRSWTQQIAIPQIPMCD
jgi:PAS domain S-box-containing protein